MKFFNQNRRRKLKRAGQMFLLACGLLSLAPDGLAQSFPEGFQYQAVLRDASGVLMANTAVDVQIKILANTATGTNLYEEIHSITTNNYGHMALVIGTGAPTVNGQTTDFSTIDWSIGTTFINLQTDIGSTGTFTDVLTSQLFAVPYAMHSKTTDQTWAISGLDDVDVTGLVAGQTLTWDGTNWVPGSIAAPLDTVGYAFNADSASYADTAGVALNCISSIPSDTALFAYNSDTANVAINAINAMSADTANYADTAAFAWNCIDGWSRAGNTLAVGDFLGTNNAEDLVFKTSGTEVLRITAAGRVGYGTSTPAAGLHMVSDEGFVFSGTVGSGTSQTFTGSRVAWYPRKAHFYAGSGTVGLNNVNIGAYSFGTGYNSIPKGNYSVAVGFSSQASGEASFAGGFDSKANGDYSIAFGHVSEANGEAGVAMGRGAWAHGESAVAMGYHPHATGAYSVAFGYQCQATDTSSYAFGHNAHSDHKGSFVYNDEKDGTHLYSNAENQFMVRASGGTIFYSDAGATTGVILNAGAGAWSFLSDSTKKRNIVPVNGDDILNRLASVEVSTWNYKSQSDDILHIGPMAQDFHAAFGFGASDTTICTSDIDGVNMAALQALIVKSNALEEKAQALENAQSEMETLKAERDQLRSRIERMEALLNEVLEEKKTAAAEK